MTALNDRGHSGNHRTMQRRFTLASVLFALASTNAHADTALPMTVRGSIDAPALRARIAGELARTMTLVDECTAPCLEIAVARGKASVSFVPASGDARTRIVDLGADRSQWPLVITLLAGNVVRDEASDLLARLPKPRPVGPAVPTPSPEPAPTPTPAPEPTPAPDPSPSSTDPDADADADVNADADSDTGLAPPSVAPSVAPVAVPVPEPERESMLLSFGFVPGLSMDWTHVGRVHHTLSVDLLVGVSGGSSLLTLSGIADIERGDVSGVQVGGVAAIARRVSGIQLGGVAAVSGDLFGVQIAGTAALADRVDGFQIGGIATVARKGVDGQLAGIAAVSRGRTSIQVGGIAAVTDGSAGVQVGGIATLARGTSNIQVGGIAAVSDGTANIQVGGIAAVAHGSANIQAGGIAAVSDGTSTLQVGGIASVARDANFQVAGVVNVARRLRGIQIAPINVARKVEGVQIGVLNVGGSADGFSFGLINIVPGGRADVEATIDTSRIGTVLFRHGGQRWHNVYGVGGHNVDETGPNDDVWMYGLGFGPSWRVRHARIDLEAMGWQVNHGARHSTDVSVLGQLRLSVAYGIGPIALVAGGVLNTHISSDHESPFLLERRKPGEVMDTNDKYKVEVWPSAFVGLRL